MEIVIIGGIAAGMGAAAKAARENPEANITVIEKEEYVSFGACGLPYYLGGQFEDENFMFARTVQQMEKTGIDIKIGHEATKIDYDKKVVTYENVQTKEEQFISYDRLMIASGASAIIPKIEGVDAKNVYTFTRLKAVQEIKDHLDDYQNITVIGGGFIGVEVSDQLAQLGKKVTMIEGLDRLMSTQFDPEFSEKIKTAVEEEGVEILLDQFVKELVVTDGIVTQVKTDEKTIDTDLVILAIGYSPNTAFAKDERLNMLKNGAIVIDPSGETSIPDVFSAGDCASSMHRQLGDIYLPLATMASKIGRIVGVNIVSENKKTLEFIGSLGTGAVKAGNYEAGRTGMNEAEAEKLGIEYKTTLISTPSYTNYWPNPTSIDMKLIYEVGTKKLLGAQVFGEKDAVLRMTALTTAIHAGLSTDEIGFIDYAYAPPFATTWEPLNIAANTAK
ncbi:CoA-disulfide reductase [Jeotgalibaca sp. MA1X17-3]|uniref:CoA-disulfide reductase n=1 Tax=Jeotgalibaca sp. MA1X17-3 TaxID=2908211 RepID=UPI001F360971|nr:CoA-disulfide reductase [Jeotgalibaca sp. MA1X17-3]UJF15587.1 CoA-disulfide reductase [Jeotgalibaca sp. MA1X17-3]